MAGCWLTGTVCDRVDTAAQRAEVLKDFSRSSSSASSFASVVEETEGVDGEDTGLVSSPRGQVPHRGLMGAQWFLEVLWTEA